MDLPVLSYKSIYIGKRLCVFHLVNRYEVNGIDDGLLLHSSSSLLHMYVYCKNNYPLESTLAWRHGWAWRHVIGFSSPAPETQQWAHRKRDTKHCHSPSYTVIYCQMCFHYTILYYTIPYHTVLYCTVHYLALHVLLPQCHVWKGSSSFGFRRTSSCQILYLAQKKGVSSK